MRPFPITAVRSSFPALAVRDDGRARIYLDAPGGTQVCEPAIRQMVAHLEGGTANAGGCFASSVETDRVSREAHLAMADLLGGDAGEIAFGPNMTSLVLALSRALAQDWAADDEIVLTRLDHDANVMPWLLVARDRGVTVRWLDFDPTTGTLDLDALPALLNERTRLVAVGGASNALGTVNDLAAIVTMVRAGCDAIIHVDAVQWVPHLPTDVSGLGCDLLTCSPYKVFGPHQGVLWGKRDLLNRIGAYKLRPSPSQPPATRFETGTPSFEGQAGVLGAINYLEWLGLQISSDAPNSRRARLLAAMEGIASYEQQLGERLLAGLRSIKGLKLWGPPTMEGRVPTFAFTLANHTPAAIAEHLAARGIFAWAGHFYAVEVVARLGLAESGGLLRVGLCHYNTADEADKLIAALAELVN